MAYNAVTASSTTELLTNEGRLLRRFNEGDATPTAFDNILGEIIYEASHHIQQNVLHRWIASREWTEYVDGDNTDAIKLANGPVGSVTSVHHVLYSTTDGSSRTETLTEIYPYEYVVEGLLSEKSNGAGTIRLLGARTEYGRRNYKVVHTSGWTTVPEPLVMAASELSLSMFNQRRTAGMIEKNLDDGDVRFLTPLQSEQRMLRLCKPFIVKPRRVSWLASQ